MKIPIVVDIQEFLRDKEIRRVGLTPYFKSVNGKFNFLFSLKDKRNLFSDFGGCPRNSEKDIFLFLQRQLSSDSCNLEKSLFQHLKLAIKNKEVIVWTTTERIYYHIFFRLKERYDDSNLSQMIWLTLKDFFHNRNISIPIFLKYWRNHWSHFNDSFLMEGFCEEEILSSLPTSVDSPRLLTSDFNLSSFSSLTYQDRYPLPSDFHELTPECQKDSYLPILSLNLGREKFLSRYFRIPTPVPVYNPYHDSNSLFFHSPEYFLGIEDLSLFSFNQY